MRIYLSSTREGHQGIEDHHFLLGDLCFQKMYHNSQAMTHQKDMLRNSAIISIVSIRSRQEEDPILLIILILDHRCLKTRVKFTVATRFLHQVQPGRLEALNQVIQNIYHNNGFYSLYFCVLFSLLKIFLNSY